MTAIAPPTTTGSPTSRRAAPVPSRRTGWIVAGSLLAGLAGGLLLVAAPFVPPTESATSGALLLGFSLGWAMLAALTARFTERPQSWALALAGFTGSGGLLLLTLGADVQPALGWIWPPALLVLLVWTVTRVRRDLPTASRRWLVHPVLAVLLLAAIGGAYETGSAAFAAPRPAMPGTLVDVGGHRLHLDCTGSGSPVVVLESGGGETSATWGWIAPVLAGTTRVCVYDRAGRGWSDDAATTQDAAQIATDLHTLLDRAGVPGPYLLVGHSFGGRYVLTFADRHEDDVAGLVLIDVTAPVPGVPAVGGRTGTERSEGLAERIAALVSSTARVGVGRLLGQSDYAGLPADARAAARASVATASHIESTVLEYVRAGASGSQAARLEDLGGRPLMVVAAGSSSPSWMDAQERLALLSANSAYRVVDGATHAGLLHDEQYAAATTESILEVVSAIRTDRPLADPA